MNNKMTPKWFWFVIGGLVSLLIHDMLQIFKFLLFGKGLLLLGVLCMIIGSYMAIKDIDNAKKEKSFDGQQWD